MRTIIMISDRPEDRELVLDWMRTHSIELGWQGPAKVPSLFVDVQQQLRLTPLVPVQMAARQARQPAGDDLIPLSFLEA